MAIAAEYKMGGFRIRVHSTPTAFRIVREERSSMAVRWQKTHEESYDRQDSGPVMRAFEEQVQRAISYTSRSMFHDNDPTH